MKKNQIIQLKGTLGFLEDPIMEVLDVGETLVTLRHYPLREGGILSDIEGGRYSIEMIEKMMIWNVHQSVAKANQQHQSYKRNVTSYFLL